MVSLTRHFVSNAQYIGPCQLPDMKGNFARFTVAAAAVMVARRLARKPRPPSQASPPSPVSLVCYQKRCLTDNKTYAKCLRDIVQRQQQYPECDTLRRLEIRLRNTRSTAANM